MQYFCRRKACCYRLHDLEAFQEDSCEAASRCRTCSASDDTSVLTTAESNSLIATSRRIVSAARDGNYEL